jgi:hypothetical protein
MEYKKKWDKYTVGKVKWINRNRSHPCRDMFVQNVQDAKVTSVLEIGGGELIEARQIVAAIPGFDYHVVDLSKVFLKFCKQQTGIQCHRGDMMSLPFEDDQFDMVYGSSILEHAPELRQVMRECARVSSRFTFNMFKWRMKGKGLDTRYVKKKQYYSTPFPIDKVLDLIKSLAELETPVICGEDVCEAFDDHRKTIGDVDEHRNGNYLVLRGRWKV